MSRSSVPKSTLSHSHHRPPPPPHPPKYAGAWRRAKPAAAQVTRRWEAPLAAGRGGLLQSRRGGLRQERRRLRARGPEARSGAGQRGAAPPLRGTGAQQRRLEFHGPLQRRSARHAAEGARGTRHGRTGNCSPTSGSSAGLASPAGSNGASSTRQRR